MSIFKESFQPYVSKQLKIREEIIKGGNQHRFGNPKISFEYPTITNVVKESVNLPPGAFYTYTTSKQCIIRMSSGVNLTNPNLLENYGFENPNDLLGPGLAIRYILEGGIPAKNIDFGEAQSKFVDGDLSQIKTIPRGKSTRGFARGYGSTYGDPFIRSDAQDGYGIVPMPGIIDANIRTKTAYGSIREAQINFVCHNRRQLEILELLYMRPGFPVLLEWGWTPFINNAGELIKNFPYYKNWFNENTNINDINNDILIQKINHSGNYDGFVGFIKNFEISARADGGYDCTTHLTAMGEILEGLKGQRTGKTYKQEEESIEVDDFEFYLKSIKEFSESYTVRNNKETQNYNELYPTNAELLDSYQELASLYSKDSNYTIFSQEQLEIIQKEEYDKFIAQSAGSNAPSSPDMDDKTKTRTEGGTKYAAEITRIEEILDEYIIRKGETLSINGLNLQPSELETFNEGRSLFNLQAGTETLDTFGSQYVYIKWELLISILNSFIIPHYQKGTSKQPVLELIHKDLNYTTYKLKENLIDERIEDDNVTIKDLKSNLKTIDSYLDISSNPKICILPHQIKKENYQFTKLKNETPTTEGMVSSKSPLDEYESNRKIKDIFFNIDYLESTYKKMLYDSEGGIKEDFGIINFLEKIWSDANQACSGTHNFILQTDEPHHSNRVRVVDLAYQNTKLNNPSKLHEIKIQGNKSIVRDFSYNTTIDNKFSSTIAIAAQAPKSVNTLDSITFEAFNRDIEYRFFSDKDLNRSSLDKGKEIIRLSNKYSRDLKKIEESINKIKQHRIQINKGTYNKEKVSNNVSRVKNLENLLINLTSRYGYSENQEGGNWTYRGFIKKVEDTGLSDLSKSAVIPLKFGCVMDGISGIVIGNVFKVEKTKLPIGYQEDDIAFCVLSEDQKITAGQDWTTELSGQMIFLDIAKEIPSSNTTQSDTSETENPTDDAIKEEEKNYRDINDPDFTDPQGNKYFIDESDGSKRRVIVVNINDVSIYTSEFSETKSPEELIEEAQTIIAQRDAQGQYDESQNTTFNLNYGE